MSEIKNLDGVVNERRFYYFTKSLFKRLPQTLIKQGEDITNLKELLAYNELEVLNVFCNSYLSKSIEARDMSFYMEGVDLSLAYLKDSLELFNYEVDIFLEFNKRLNWIVLILIETYNTYRISSHEIWRILQRNGMTYLINMFEPYHCLPNNLVVLKCIYDLDINFTNIKQNEWSDWIFSLNKEQQDQLLDEAIELIKKDMWII